MKKIGTRIFRAIKVNDFIFDLDRESGDRLSVSVLVDKTSLTFSFISDNQSVNSANRAV